MMRNVLIFPAVTCFFWFLTSCSSNDPSPENPEEIITDVTLRFSTEGGSSSVEYGATDPDGDGPQDFLIENDILLESGTTYVLTIELTNSLENESISNEVREEAHEHMLFFSWTDGLFASPGGNGNVDSPPDPVNYLDQDINGLPLGLMTSWTAGDAGTGSLRIILKHQPGSKSSSSSASDGETDLDVTWNVVVE